MATKLVSKIRSVQNPQIPFRLLLNGTVRHFSQQPISITSPPLDNSDSNSAIADSKPPSLSTKRNKLFVKRWRLYASPEEALPLDSAAPLETAQQVVAASDDGTATVISILLFVAFVILSILTIGGRGRREKEEAAKKKSGKKGKVRARTGPRGFGQKINDDDPDAF